MGTSLRDDLETARRLAIEIGDLILYLKSAVEPGPCDDDRLLFESPGICEVRDREPWGGFTGWARRFVRQRPGMDVTPLVVQAAGYRYMDAFKSQAFQSLARINERILAASSGPCRVGPVCAGHAHTALWVAGGRLWFTTFMGPAGPLIWLGEARSRRDLPDLDKLVEARAKDLAEIFFRARQVGGSGYSLEYDLAALSLPAVRQMLTSLPLREVEEAIHRARIESAKAIAALPGPREDSFPDPHHTVRVSPVKAIAQKPKGQALALEDRSECHADGPACGCYFWWSGVCYDIPKGVCYRLLEFMWGRDSARFDDLDGTVFEDGFESDTLHRLNTVANRALARIPGMTRRLFVPRNSRKVVWKAGP